MFLAKNVIRKQAIQFRYNGNENSFTLQNEVNDWFTLTLMPQIEQQLEPFCLADKHFTIDKVEITADANDRDWKQNIEREVIFQLREKLEGFRALANTPAGTLVDHTGEIAVDNPSAVNYQIRTQHTISGKIDIAHAPGQKKRKQLPKKKFDATDNNEHIFPDKADEKWYADTPKFDELVIYFFTKGYLPWWTSAVITRDFDLALRNWIGEDKPDDGRIAYIRQQLQEKISASIAIRMLNHMPGSLFYSFLKNIFKEEIELLSQMQEFFIELLGKYFSGISKKKILQPLFKFILTELFANNGKIDKVMIVKLLYSELQKQKQVGHLIKINPAAPRMATNPIEISWQQELIRQQPKHEETGENKITGILQKQSDKAGGIEKPANTIGQIKDQLLQSNKIISTADDLSDGIYIENAGAVIVAAFLPALLKKLKIVTDAGMANSNMAALIIQYIVTGNSKIAEYELVLPKILCGLGVEKPVDTSKRITATQKNEVNEMLLSVIEHWAVLKNTSVTGLRETFLQRNGKLTFKNNEWLLQVEQKSFDMLLQQLPWNISMIKLQWMMNLLKTEWV